MYRSLCERISVLVSDYRLWRGKQKQVDIRSTLLCPQLPFLRICYSVVIIWVLWKNKTFYDLVFGLQCNLAAGVMLGKLHRFALFVMFVLQQVCPEEHSVASCFSLVYRIQWWFASMSREFQENISTIISLLQNSCLTVCCVVYCGRQAPLCKPHIWTIRCDQMRKMYLFIFLIYSHREIKIGVYLFLTWGHLYAIAL